MSTVKLHHINKVYENNVQAVFDFNLDIADGEFIVFVGPSGCGKSTTLRMIAGLEDITDGDFFIDDERCNDVLPKNRDIAMVFQNYALYPHMSVYENMAFGLKNRKVPKEEIDKRILEAAENLNITEYLNRKPKALSGGQCQRVALGRAIVRHAKVFLMDEPLSNLDAKLRVQMRANIIKIHKRIGSITIYVTHDQTEAMTMADRIVVMKKGHIQQIGTPREIYNRPYNKFVAGFIGSPSMNFIDGKVSKDSISFGNIPLALSDQQRDLLKDYVGKEVTIGIRPEDIKVSLEKKPGYVPMDVDVVELLGHEQILHLPILDSEILVQVSAKIPVKMGDKVYIEVDSEYLHTFDKDTEVALF